MTPSEVLALAVAEGIFLEVRGDLIIATPPRRASPALRAALREHKAAVLTLLVEDARSPPNGNGHHSYESQQETEEDAPNPEKKTRRTRRDTFAAPDLLRRRLLHVDSGLRDAELRVYVFLVGQTMGWGKDADGVSYAQIRDGIRRRNGEIWSTGTGLATRTIIRACDSLVERKLITRTSNSGPKRGHVANIYALILEEAPEGP